MKKLKKVSQPPVERKVQIEPMILAKSQDNDIFNTSGDYSRRKSAGKEDYARQLAAQMAEKVIFRIMTSLLQNLTFRIVKKKQNVENRRPMIKS